ncbi:MAG: hypothetical protein KGO94_07160 [Alphaproteobacteria bacterium]|nr:hypothetical protein [Alphaproteobacteria bacterium]
MNRFLLLGVTVGLCGCAQQASSVRITQSTPPEPKVAEVAVARSEPVFYNGKIYQINFVANPAGGYAFAVSGMTAGQQKDAVAVSTSSVRHFACKEKQSGQLLNQPTYDGVKWRMSVHCV